jgi:3-phenylpropionate/cinnamic acid dioxygenase small subunit
MISHEQAIANLIYRYAFLVDDGDFAGLGTLFADGQLVLNDAPAAVGAAGVERFAHASLQLHGDGTPGTRHVISNVIIEIDDDEMAARAEAYYTVFQALADFPLQPIACGRYQDSFMRRNGRWVYRQKVIRTGLMGDLSRHRRS